MTIEKEKERKRLAEWVSFSPSPLLSLPFVSLPLAKISLADNEVEVVVEEPLRFGRVGDVWPPSLGVMSAVWRCHIYTQLLTHAA